MKPMNMTQKEWVIKQLNEKSYISRNECLRHYITRLSAIILQLKKEGWVFKAEYKSYYNKIWKTKERDYVYHVIHNPNIK